MQPHAHMRAAGLLLCSIMAGCGPHLKGPDGKRVNLADYDCVVLQGVEIDPELPYPGLPDQLAGLIQSRLVMDKYWAQPESGFALLRAGPSRPYQRAVDLSVTIVKASYPSKGARIWFGAANSITCQMQVHDHESKTPLGSAEVVATKGPPTGGLIGSGLVGVIVNASVDTSRSDELLLCFETADEIVDVLDRAKREKRGHSPTPAATQAATPAPGHDGPDTREP